MTTEVSPGNVRLNDGLGLVPKLTSAQVCNIGFAVLRAHNDDRLWRALTYDSGPYDLTTPNLALQELGAAFYAAGYAEAPRTTTKVEISADPEMVRRVLRAETEASLLRAALHGYEALQRDAERYRWLRLQDWDTCPLAVVAHPKDAIKLGHDAPSRDRLDAMIDAHVAEVQGFLNHTLDALDGGALGPNV